MRRALLLPLVALAALVSTGDALAVTGEQRVLVLLTTWGPQPFAGDEVRRVVFEETDAFLRESSFGQVSLRGDVTPWLPAFAAQPDCDTRDIARASRTVAAGRGFDLGAYDRFLYLFPRNACPFSGLGGGQEVWLNGRLSRFLVAHELGHTFGLGHASTWVCGSGTCTTEEYGNPYSVMGDGDGDFDAFEKFQLGWLTNVTRASAHGDHAIGSVESPGSLPGAFVVTTARSEYWFEHRSREVRAPFSSRTVAPGVLVIAGPNPAATPGDQVYTRENLLLPDPAGKGRAALSPGERFGESGAFDVVVTQSGAGGAVLRFAWSDTVAPRAPRLVTPGRRVPVRGAWLNVTWLDAVERGSGLVRYEVSLDGGAPVRVNVDYRVSASASFRKPRPGPHRIVVVAVDRAGNRSAAAARRFTVVRGA